MFAPPVEEVYPPGFDTAVSVGAIAGPLEGAARPGHFDGVATVVAILFALVGAERAYFGLKDAQQVRVIRRMALRPRAADRGRGAATTVREPDGLALSSRNARLLAGRSRRRPGDPSRAAGGAASVGAGERRRAAVRASMGRGPRGPSAPREPDYVSVADADTLEELATIGRRGRRCSRWRSGSRASASSTTSGCGPSRTASRLVPGDDRRSQPFGRGGSPGARRSSPSSAAPRTGGAWRTETSAAARRRGRAT